MPSREPLAQAAPADEAAPAAPVSRRTVLTAAAAGGLIALAPQLPGAVLRTAPLTVITDPRLAHTRLFVDGIGAAAAHTLAVGTDAVRTWQQCRTLAARGARVAGLTTWIDALVIQGCAREDGFACLHRGEHQQEDAGAAHALADDALLAALLRAAGTWPRALGEHLASSPLPRTSGTSMPPIAAGQHSGHVRLVSWLLISAERLRGPAGRAG